MLLEESSLHASEIAATLGYTVKQVVDVLDTLELCGYVRKSTVGYRAL